MGHTEPDRGSAQSNGEAAAARDLSGLKRRPGETPGMHDAAKPWRVALQRGRRGSPRPCGPPRRWQSRRAETGLAATVGHRHAAAAAWDGSAKASQGTLEALLRLRPSHTARRRIAHYNSATPRPPRPRDADPGRGRLHRVRPNPAGGAGATRLDALSGRGACGCRAQAAAAPASQHRVPRGAKHVRVDRRRPPPIACARRCARARAGGTAAHAPVELRPQDPAGEAPRGRVHHAPGPLLCARPGGGHAARAPVLAAAGDGATGYVACDRSCGQGIANARKGRRASVPGGGSTTRRRGCAQRARPVRCGLAATGGACSCARVASVAFDELGQAVHGEKIVDGFAEKRQESGVVVGPRGAGAGGGPRGRSSRSCSPCPRAGGCGPCAGRGCRRLGSARAASPRHA